MKTQQPEWEGFQQFYDHSENNELNDPNQPRPSIEEQTEYQKLKQPKPKEETKDDKPKTSPNKKLKIKQKLPQLNDKTIQPNPYEKSEEKIRESEKSPIKNYVRQNKYERIPIVKKEDDIRYNGNIFYRGYVPKTSDNYFRLLKDISFTDPVKKPTVKTGQNIVFDSRFQSANLNLVFQGRRYLI